MAIFKDRDDAGRQLVACLQAEVTQGAVILALPRGGVPVAYPVAVALDLPMYILVVRKLGLPYHQELAFGAIAGEDITYLNSSIVEEYGLSDEQIEAVKNAELHELKRRESVYGHPPPNLEGRRVILIDDGVATGATVTAAIELIKQQGPEHLTMGVPVIATETYHRLLTSVDAVVACEIADDMFAIGQFYDDFSQVSDLEVQSLVH